MLAPGSVEGGCPASGAVEIKILDVSGLPTGADAADVDAPAAAALVAAATPFETERESLSNSSLDQERYGISARTELRAAARLILDFSDRLLVAFAVDGRSQTLVDNGFGLWRLDYKVLYDLFAESVNRYKKKALEDCACKLTKDGGIGDRQGLGEVPPVVCGSREHRSARCYAPFDGRRGRVAETPPNPTQRPNDP